MKGCLRLFLYLFLFAVIVGACNALTGNTPDATEDAEDATEADSEAQSEATPEAENEAQSEANTDDIPESEKIHNALDEYLTEKSTVTEFNEISVDDTDDGYHVMIDYLNFDNVHPYAYNVQIETVFVESLEAIQDFNIDGVNFYAQANLTSGMADVYEVEIYDVDDVTRDNMHDKAEFTWKHSLLEDE